MKKENTKTDNLIRQIHEKVCAIEGMVSGLLENQKKTVYLAAAGPDLPLSIVELDEVNRILPCFDEDDVFRTLPDSEIMMSYCPEEVVHLPGKNYLTGSVIFFRLNKESYEIDSLHLEDVCKIVEFLEKQNTALMADGIGFKGICLN